MENSEEILLKIVAPSVGFVLANAMFFSSVPAMLRCKRLGNLAGTLQRASISPVTPQPVPSAAQPPAVMGTQMGFTGSLLQLPH
jgi:hypothetical protein